MLDCRCDFGICRNEWNGSIKYPSMLIVDEVGGTEMVRLGISENDVIWEETLSTMPPSKWLHSRTLLLVTAFMCLVHNDVGVLRNDAFSVLSVSPPHTSHLTPHCPHLKLKRSRSTPYQARPSPHHSVMSVIVVV